MPLTDEERSALTERAKAEGVDPGDLIAAAEDADKATAPAPGKTDVAASGAAPTGAESGAKAHGGRGYFAYEFPFLRVNEVRASLFLDPLPDGDLITGEWLTKHTGPAAPAADASEQGATNV
jgi:hypothetical protein